VPGPARPALRSLVQSGLLRLLPGEERWEFTHALGYRFARQEKGSDPSLREKLAEVLRTHLAAALASGSPALPAVVEHASALLRTDDDNQLWDRLVFYLLYDAYHRLLALGRLPLAKLALGAVRSWLERHPGTLAEEGEWLREQGALLDREGNVAIAQGDLAGALSAYQELQAIAQRLAESDPSNSDWQRNLSVSHEKVGDVLQVQGDLAGALSAYRESQAIRQRLAESDRSNADWQRDLSLTLTVLAELHEQQSELSEALPLAEESLVIDERLAALDRTNVMWQNDVAFTRALVARLRVKAGELRQESPDGAL
jgi:tetratricopeptide (TPR) repeat protein